MLGLVFDLALRMLGRALKPRSRRPRPDRPDPRRVERAASAYRRWADDRRFVHDRTARAYRGAIGRHVVLVRPGLEGSAPVGVEVEVRFDAPEATRASIRTVLLKPSDEGETAIEKALAALFRDLELGGALRSVALTPTLVRLRFAALTMPRIVDSGLRAVADAIESCAGASGEPYR